MANIEFTREAYVICTTEQRNAFFRLLDSESVKHIQIQRGGFDLPNGYLAFRIDYNTGSTPMYGGVAPDGSVST